MTYSDAAPRLALLLVVGAGACEPEGRLLAPGSDVSVPESPASRALLHEAQWSEPVNLGPPIDTPAIEQNPSLSRDGLTLYFASDRPGSMGLRDLYVAHRATRRSAWQTPVNLGPTVNSAADDIGPHLSPDGRTLFFASTRPGGFGRFDIYVSRRTNRTDDLSWSPPVNLGAGINTATTESGPSYLARDEDDEGETREKGGRQRDEDEAGGSLYFSRGVQLEGASDIYVADVSRAGEVRSPAVLVSELSVPGVNDAAPTIRRNGREIFFWSDRPGSTGQDLWTSTRRRASDPWSAPTRLGNPPNSASDENGPGLSADAHTIFFTSNRAGGQGSLDIWMTTRSGRRTP
jgi:Tol biopolymer transport system component